ncbi:MAG: lamin tail domain-containing protein [Patescibacteria group bacterium]
MSKKVILFLVFTLFLCLFNLAHADLAISEIMYDLDGADIDWVEVYNGDSADVDLTTLKLLISNSTSNHGIVSYAGSSILHQGEYAVIAVTSQVDAFIAKWGSTGNIFTSSFSLPNTTGKVEMNNGDKDVPMSSVTYDSSQGATGDGKSLQLVGGAWIASTPTPGASNQASDSDTDSDTDDTNDTNTSNDTNTTSSASNNASNGSASPKVAEQKIKAKILTNTLVFAQQPFEMQIDVSGIYGQKVVLGKAYWNFGDGGSLEQINDFGKFYHTYYYPGDYVLYLEYYERSSSPIPDATSKVIIKVVSIGVTITKVGGVEDFFIELTNNSVSDIDVSNWFINANGKTFILPKNSLIMSKKQMTISGKVTGFTYGDQSSLKLFSSTNEFIFDYNAPITKAKTLVRSAQKTQTPAVPSLSEQVSVSDLGASVALSDDAGESYFSYPMLTAFLFVGGSAGAVYFIRKRKIVSNAGDDFKILDE